jgi:SAM-dependent methyltransferase
MRWRPHRRRTPPPAPGGYDSWLTAFCGDELAAIDAACASGGSERWALFRDLDADLWALLLTQEYEAYPHIRALLPDMPDPALQQRWTGASGAALAAQSVAFYRRLRERYDGDLADARVLDFGCGWGRLTRYLARDVAPGNLHGCDPDEDILEVCRRTRVPATLARSDPMPQRLPFAGAFDLAFAFSVFTHLSEPAHARCLAALHAALAPGATLVLTIRPPEYARRSPDLGREPLDGARYLFVPHPGEPGYGEAVITLPYVRERWAPQFELRHVDLLAGDLFQVVLTLRRAC